MSMTAPSRIYLINGGKQLACPIGEQVPNDLPSDAIAYNRQLEPVSEPHVITLAAGLENKQTITLLLSLTRIDSEELKCALVDYYTTFVSVKHVCLVYDIKEQNFKRAQNRLNEVLATVHQLSASVK